MADLQKNYVSLVALGSQNPQILNVDFLVKHDVIPKDEPPFRDLLGKTPPFTHFLSVPPVTQLHFGPIEFFVDHERFQVREVHPAEWENTKVVGIARRYFAVLEFTPLKVVGININAKLQLSDAAEANKFQEILLPQKSFLRDMVSVDKLAAGITLKYPSSEVGTRITLTVSLPILRASAQETREINWNYEFDFQDNWAPLDRFDALVRECESLQQRILGGL